MGVVGTFLDASGLVSDSLSCLLGTNSASWVASEVLDLSDASAALVWLCDGLLLDVIKDNTCDVTKVVLALALDVLNTLVHVVFSKEATGASLGLHAVRNELLSAALGVSWDCSDSVATACLSS